MAQYQFGKLKIEPAKNPAVLDTATWDPGRAWEMVSAVPLAAWEKPLAVLTGEAPLPVNDCVALCPSSQSRLRGADSLLAKLGDRQRVLLAVGDAVPPGPPLGEFRLADGRRTRVFPADAEVIEWYVRHRRPDKGPKALGAVPRLGIGTRMSTAIWPGVWPALARRGPAANAIQNSVRELNLLEDLRAGRPALSNYMFGFGTLYEGHTGSTFEGLWLAGVLSALESDGIKPYGADADHIMVKRTPDGLDRAKRVLSAARRYSFFTLDVSDILDYAATADGGVPEIVALIPGVRERRESVACHISKDHPGGPMSEDSLARCVAKYRSAWSAVTELAEHIRRLKPKTPFDLELSIDETPPGVRTLDCMTTKEELSFLLAEIRRRALPITHIAPNFGVEKGSDYKGSDGLPGLEQRVRSLTQLAGDHGIMLDCHSGDDLSSATRRAIGRAARGHIHFKISPMLQVLFAAVLHEACPDRFQFWWDDTLAYARHEADNGSELAVQCLREYEASGPQRRPLPSHRLFHYYNFATVGRRDAEGQFVHRDKFYDLPHAFYAAYAQRVARLLHEVMADLFALG